MSTSSRVREWGIWGFAFGYFACYAPYSALTKAVSKGLLPSMHGHGVPGFELLPASTMASLVGMLIFLTAMGWWKHAGRARVLGREVPMPGIWTFLSGLCTAGIIGTTTLAYTFSGVSIVFMMLLMKGGVLIIAPVVDAVSRRKVRWFSWVALGLSLTSLLVAFSSDAGWKLTAVAIADVVVYLGSYLVRLRFMSRLAKTDDPDISRRYFVEEQMVATPAVVLGLAIAAFAGSGDIALQLRAGFTSFFHGPYAMDAIAIGVFSQGTGIFGSLIFLDKRENTFCVPVNRASSVLAGILATYGLYFGLGQHPPDPREMVGAVLIIAAIFVLAIPGLRAAAARKAAVPALVPQPVPANDQSREAEVGRR